MKHIFFIIALFFATVCSATTIKFETVANTNGKIDINSDGLYKWAEWKTDTTAITIAMSDSIIYVNDKKFSIIENPKKWHVMKDRKFVDFQCVDENLLKTNIRIVEYDNKHYDIKVLGEHNGQKYLCRYVKG